VCNFVKHSNRTILEKNKLQNAESLLKSEISLKTVFECPKTSYFSATENTQNTFFHGKWEILISPFNERFWEKK